MNEERIQGAHDMFGANKSDMVKQEKKKKAI